MKSKTNHPKKAKAPRRPKPIEVPEPLPCPCCGESRPAFFDKQTDQPYGIFAGVRACMESGVHCYTCGLSMDRSFPEKWPRGINDADDLYRYVLVQAIEAWNRRATT